MSDNEFCFSVWVFFFPSLTILYPKYLLPSYLPKVKGKYFMEIAFRIVSLSDTATCSMPDSSTTWPNAMLVQIQEF